MVNLHARYKNLDPVFQKLNALTAPLAILFADDPSDRLIYVNRSFVALTGFRQEEAIGQNARFLQAEQTCRNHLNVLRDGLSRRRQTEVCLLNQRRDGALFNNHLHLMPMHARDETPLIVGCLFDVETTNDHLEAMAANNNAPLKGRTDTVPEQRAAQAVLAARQLRAKVTLNRVRIYFQRY